MSITKSVQPRKQRLAVYEAPMHMRQKLVHATLNEKLRKEYGRRSLALHKGDQVEVMRGRHKGVRGEVKEVNLKRLRITVDQVKRKKVDGTEVNVLLHPSNLRIVQAVMDDRRRAKIIERSGGKVTVSKKVEKKPEKEEKKTEGAKCPICNETFESNNAVNLHITSAHKEYAIEK